MARKRKYRLTPSDKVFRARWQAKWDSAMAAAGRGDIRAGFALIGIGRTLDYVDRYGEPPDLFVRRGA